MLDRILPFLQKEMNAYFRLKYNTRRDMVALVNLQNQGDNVLREMENTVLMTLINVEEERTKRAGETYVRTRDSYARLNPPIHLNFCILFAANFESKNYIEALKFTSAVVSFFQVNNVFFTQSHPELKNDMERLAAEIVTIDFHHLNGLWATVGVPYMPSVVYRFRTVAIQEGVTKGGGALISGIDTSEE